MHEEATVVLVLCEKRLALIKGNLFTGLSNSRKFEESEGLKRPSFSSH